MQRKTIGPLRLDFVLIYICVAGGRAGDNSGGWGADYGGEGRGAGSYGRPAAPPGPRGDLSWNNWAGGSAAGPREGIPPMGSRPGAHAVKMRGLQFQSKEYDIVQVGWAYVF